MRKSTGGKRERDRRSRAHGSRVSDDTEWPRGQAVKTSPFHGGNMGPNPVGVIEKNSLYYRIRNSTINTGISYLALRTLSSVGQSSRLITDRSWVRVPEGPLQHLHGNADASKTVFMIDNYCRFHKPAWRNWQTRGT